VHILHYVGHRAGLISQGTITRTGGAESDADTTAVCRSQIAFGLLKSGYARLCADRYQTTSKRPEPEHGAAKAVVQQVGATSCMPRKL
jgi:hypothetical protein